MTVRTRTRLQLRGQAAFRRTIGAIDLTDVALVGGLALLWVGISRMAPGWEPIVVGTIIVLYGAAPMLAALRGR
jgi:hypothetical protein